MLRGTRLFDEPTRSETLAAVLKGDLKLQTLPASTPSVLRRLLNRCLDRDRRRRLRDIGEARIMVEEMIAHPEADPTAADSHKPRRPHNHSGVARFFGPLLGVRLRLAL